MVNTGTRQPKPPWVLFLAGFWVGVAMTVGVVLVLAWRTDTPQRSIGETLRGRGLTAAAREWEKRWPTLTFPARAQSGPPSPVSIAYDEFQDCTSFETAFPLPGSRPRVNVTFRNIETGNVTYPPAPPATVDVAFYAEGYSAGSEMVFLADGVRIEPILVLGGWEDSLYRLTTEDLLTLVNAQSVRGRVDGTEFALTPAEQGMLRDFASMLKP